MFHRNDSKINETNRGGMVKYPFPRVAVWGQRAYCLKTDVKLLK